ncbi:hypothetical protein ABIA71_001770 [Stenotrophomonas sp. 2619]|uniref:hypothetical protein n=1 Tax=Stenotrophomonas sp. 2619 TaxID=3156316 RepID=UPI0033966D81
MGLFSRLFRGPEFIEHPQLGRLELLTGSNDSHHWIQAPEEEEDGVVLASFHVIGKAPPSEAQIAFLRRLIDEPTWILDDVQAVIGPAYAQYFGEPLPRAWPLVMQLCSVSVPLDADPGNPWDIQLVSEQGPIFTVAFCNGVAELGSIDS